MAFEKGKSGNPSGRKKGTPNKSTAEWRMVLQGIIHANFNKSKITNDIRQLPPKHRLDIYFRFLEFVVPKPGEELPEGSDKKLPYQDFITMFQRKMNEIENL